MRVLVTGASGYIGFAVASAFRQAGHKVTGLIRRQEKAWLLEMHEIRAVVGDLTSAVFMKEMEEAEVIVHCALEMSGEGIKLEHQVTESLLKALERAKTPRTLLYTSGVWVAGNTGNQEVDEATPFNAIPLVQWRLPLMEKVLKANPCHRTVVICPGCVYGFSGSLTGLWFSSAEKGEVVVAGNGDNRWAMIHVSDLARAYVLAAEKQISGTHLYVTDHSRFTVKELALAAAAAAGVPGKVKYLNESEAQKSFGPLTPGLLVDQQISSERTQRLLGWQPRMPTFVSDVHTYYTAWKAAGAATHG